MSGLAVAVEEYKATSFKIIKISRDSELKNAKKLILKK
jgi:hypothetical protein